AEEHNKNEIVELVLSSLISCDSSNETLLEKELQKVDDEPDKNKIKEIFNNVFKSLDNDIFKQQEGYEFEDSVGTTATIALIFNKTTYVVHRGDSPTYAGYKNEQIRRITANHNLDDDGELEMLTKEVKKPHFYYLKDRFDRCYGSPRYWLDDGDLGGLKITTFFGNTYNFTSKKFPDDLPQEREMARRYSTQSGLIEINNQDIDFILVTSDGFEDVEIFLRDSVKKFKEDNEEETKAASFLMGKNGFYDEETDDATFVSIFFKQSKDETVKNLYKRINNKKFKYWGSLDKEEKFAYRKSIFSNMTKKKTQACE
ncbi:24065_t:CDS:2, partial [Racocetra persica]